MAFWEHVYVLRRKDLIPREWKRVHLRPHLEKPQGPLGLLRVRPQISIEFSGLIVP